MCKRKPENESRSGEEKKQLRSQECGSPKAATTAFAELAENAWDRDDIPPAIKPWIQYERYLDHRITVGGTDCQSCTDEVANVARKGVRAAFAALPAAHQTQFKDCALSELATYLSFCSRNNLPKATPSELYIRMLELDEEDMHQYYPKNKSRAAAFKIIERNEGWDSFMRVVGLEETIALEPLPEIAYVPSHECGCAKAVEQEALANVAKEDANTKTAEKAQIAADAKAWEQTAARDNAFANPTEGKVITQTAKEDNVAADAEAVEESELPKPGENTSSDSGEMDAGDEDLSSQSIERRASPSRKENIKQAPKPRNNCEEPVAMAVDSERAEVYVEQSINAALQQFTNAVNDCEAKLPIGVGESICSSLEKIIDRLKRNESRSHARLETTERLLRDDAPKAHGTTTPTTKPTMRGARNRKQQIKAALREERTSRRAVADKRCKDLDAYMRSTYGMGAQAPESADPEAYAAWKKRKEASKEYLDHPSVLEIRKATAEIQLRRRQFEQGSVEKAKMYDDICAVLHGMCASTWRNARTTNTDVVVAPETI